MYIEGEEGEDLLAFWNYESSGFDNRQVVDGCAASCVMLHCFANLFWIFDSLTRFEMAKDPTLVLFLRSAEESVLIVSVFLTYFHNSYCWRLLKLLKLTQPSCLVSNVGIYEKTEIMFKLFLVNLEMDPPKQDTHITHHHTDHTSQKIRVSGFDGTKRTLEVNHSRRSIIIKKSNKEIN